MEALRKKLINKRSQIENRKAKEKAIALRLQPFFSLVDEKEVAGYNPIGSEANPFGPISTYFLAPKVISEDEMIFVPNINLSRGSFGVLEPEGDLTSEVVPKLIFVPLLGFDGTNRLGYGKGYYDKYLHAHPECFSVGIAFEEQEVFLEPREWDWPLDAVVTPERVILK